MNNRKRNFMAMTLIASAVILSACNATGVSMRVGEQRHEYQEIELADADFSEIFIEMGVGKLIINGGADEFMEADFIYNVAALEPTIDERGEKLSILTPDTTVRIGSLFDIDDFRNDWDLRFNDEQAINMSIDLGVGEADLNLGSLTLRRLDIDAGVSDASVNLANSSIEILKIDAGIGDLVIDLQGQRNVDLLVDLSAGIGEVTILLPAEVGVEVDVDGGLTDINADELSLRNGRYENDAIGSGGALIEIRIDAGVGEINLLIGD